MVKRQRLLPMEWDVKDGVCSAMLLWPPNCTFDFRGSDCITALNGPYFRCGPF